MTATLNRPTCVIGQTSLYLDDLAPQSADEITERVQAFYRDFPAAARLLQDVATDANEFTGERSEALAVTYPDNPVVLLPPFHIRVNGAYYGPYSRERFERVKQEKYAEGWFNIPLPAGTIEHELGHIVDLTASYFTGADRHVSGSLLSYWDAVSVGGYAMTSPQETFADAFAAWRLGYPHGDASVQRSLAKIVRQVQDHA